MSLAKSDGFTYIEVLIAGTLLAFTLLAVCGMFVTGFANVAGAGDATVGVSAARQMVEAIRQLPFDNIINLNGFSTDNVGSLPSNDPELEIARRWRYALAGDGVGWDFSSAETTKWTSDLATQGDELSAAGTVAVTAINANLVSITVTVSVPGRWRPISVTTVVARLS